MTLKETLFLIGFLYLGYMNYLLYTAFKQSVQPHTQYWVMTKVDGGRPYYEGPFYSLDVAIQVKDSTQHYESEFYEDSVSTILIQDCEECHR